MVLNELIYNEVGERSPHARGDGPFSVAGMFQKYLFSPRAWGWSGTPRRSSIDNRVLPTRVGMVRGPGGTVRLSNRSPHARGDGPRTELPAGPAFRFSPRAWGWSGLMRVCPYCREVLPTRVGMVRTSAT